MKTHIIKLVYLINIILINPKFGIQLIIQYKDNYIVLCTLFSNPI